MTAPPDPTSLTTGAFKFVFGYDTLDDSGHRLTCSTAGIPDTGSFTFTVNGVDRRSYFTIYNDSAVASSVPLTADTLNSWIATMNGYNFQGNSITHTLSGQTHVLITPFPEVFTTYLNHDNQDASRCASECFAAVYSQATVPYFSFDAARAVTLVYNGDRAAPRPFLNIDVRHPSGALNTPTEFRVAALINGVGVTFVNGDTVLRFQYAPGIVRVGGQFSASGYATGVYPLTITVTSVYSGAVKQTVVNTKVTIVNENASSVARGWTIAGMEHIYEQGDGSVLLTNGTGSALYFAKICNPSCSYVTPAGDFSQIVDVSPLGWERRFIDSTKIRFDVWGRPVSVRDRFGNRDSIYYTGINTGKLWKIEDPTGRQILFGYGSYGLSSITDPMSRVTNITVWTDSSLRTVNDPDGDSTRFVYDSNRRLEQIVDRRGSVTRYVYNSSTWKVDSLVLPAVPINGGANASPSIALLPWQSVGVPPSATSGSPFAPVLTDSVRAVVTDPEGHVTRFTADRWGQPLTSWDALNQTTIFSRDATSGLPLAIYNVGDGDEALQWNSNGQLTYYAVTGSPGVSRRYGAYGQVDSVWNTGGGAYRAFLGVAGRTDSIRIGGQDSIKIRFTYDGQGRVLTRKDPKGHVVTFHYNSSFGSLDSTLVPGNRFTRVRFDQFGRDSAVSGTSTPWRRSIYDLMNRRIQFYDGVNASPTTFKYDNLFLVRVQDPKGQVYLFSYNALGLRTQRFDPADTLNRYESYRYNRDGSTVGWTNRRGQAVSYGYDVLHRLTAKTGTNTVADSFAYELEGRRVIMWNVVERDTLRLGPGLAWIDSVITRVAGQRFQLNKYMNPYWGRTDSTKITSSTSIAFVTRRTWYNQWTQGIDSIGLNNSRIKMAFNADGLNGTVTLPTTPQVVAGRKYTNLDRAQDDTLTPGPLGTNLSRRYGYDDMGRTKFDVNAPRDKWMQYAYDGLGRLSKVDYRRKFVANCSVTSDDGWACPEGIASALDSSRTYSYDQLGNRTDNSGTYSTGNRVLTFAGFTFEHDLDGNVTRKYGNGQDVRYYWSADGFLDSVTAGTTRIAYGYNSMHRLVRKRVGGSDRRFFLWDGNQIISELDSTAQNRVSEYAYYPGIDQPLAFVTGATTPVLTRYYRQDQLANVTAVFRDTSVVQNVTYSPWGQQQLITGTVADTNRFRWKGLMWEGDSTRLYYMRARWYDPSTGRFISEDPLGLDGGINPYVFANANPIEGRDPSGLAGGQCYLLLHHVVRDDWTGIILLEYDELIAISPSYCGLGNGGAKGGGTSGGAQQVVVGHDKCEVAGILSNYIAAMALHPQDFMRSYRSSFPPEFDFKISTPNDFYEFDGRWVHADEFGNAAAGYAGQTVFHDLGYLAVRLYGRHFASQQNLQGQYVSGEDPSDRASVPMIDAGSARAFLDAGSVSVGEGGSVPLLADPPGGPLTHPAGCAAN